MTFNWSNWKTGATGVALIALNALQAIYPVIPEKYQPIVNGIGVGLGLLLAKDWNVTGGNVKQDLSVKSERGR